MLFMQLWGKRYSESIPIFARIDPNAGVDAPAVLQHVMGRGIERKRIFRK